MRPDKSAPLDQLFRVERTKASSATSYRILRIEHAAIVGTVQKSGYGWMYFPNNARDQRSRKYHELMDSALRAHFTAADRRRIMDAVDAAEVNATIAASEARDYPPHEKET